MSVGSRGQIVAGALCGLLGLAGAPRTQVEGRVSAPEGVPRDRIDVELWAGPQRASDGRGWRGESRRVWQGITDARGRFTAELPAPGRYWAHAWFDDGERRRRAWVREVAIGDSLNLHLGRGAELGVDVRRGHVDVEDFEVICEDARVTLQGKGFARLVFDAGSEAHLQIRADSGWAELDATLTPGEYDWTVARLRTDRELRGRVVDARGHPRPDVWLHVATESEVGVVQPKSDGTFAIPGVKAQGGRLRVLSGTGMPLRLRDYDEGVFFALPHPAPAELGTLVIAR